MGYCTLPFREPRPWATVTAGTLPSILRGTISRRTGFVRCTKRKTPSTLLRSREKGSTGSTIFTGTPEQTRWTRTQSKSCSDGCLGLESEAILLWKESFVSRGLGRTRPDGRLGEHVKHAINTFFIHYVTRAQNAVAVSGMPSRCSSAVNWFFRSTRPVCVFTCCSGSADQ